MLGRADEFLQQAIELGMEVLIFLPERKGTVAAHISSLDQQRLERRRALDRRAGGGIDQALDREACHGPCIDASRLDRGTSAGPIRVNGDLALGHSELRQLADPYATGDEPELQIAIGQEFLE